MKRLLTVIVLTAAALTAGCATSAGYVDQSQVKTIKKGVTTKAEVLQALGDPSETRPTSTGQKLIWRGTKNSLDAKTFIPFYGLVAGSGSTANTVTTVTVNRQGVVIDYDHSNDVVTEDTFGNKTTKRESLHSSNDAPVQPLVESASSGQTKTSAQTAATPKKQSRKVKPGI